MILLLSGPARSGKDTVADIILEKYPQYNFERFAFAKELKKELEETIEQKYGVSVWDDQQKHLFRDELIEYGCGKRNETQGKYWVEKFINAYDVKKNYLITDFRFGGRTGEKAYIKNFIREQKVFSEVLSFHIVRIENSEPILPVINEEIRCENDLRREADELLFLKWTKELDKDYISTKINGLGIL